MRNILVCPQCDRSDIILAMKKKKKQEEWELKAWDDPERVLKRNEEWNKRNYSPDKYSYPVWLNLLIWAIIIVFAIIYFK